MWGYLEHLATLLTEMKEVLRALSSTSVQLLRGELSVRSHGRTCYKREVSLPRPRILSTSSDVTPSETGKDRELLPGKLQHY